MTDHREQYSRPPTAVIVQALVIAVGIVLWMTVGKQWIIVAGVGAFVPGILRELGVMQDLDEFQRGTSRRAAFHAYLVGGLATVCIISWLHFTDAVVQYPADMATLILVILWLTWLFSYLTSYLGPQTTATAVLLAFGAFWALFAILSGIGEASGVGEAIVGVLMHLVFVVPFALGAFAAGRWPRTTGWCLLGVGVFLLYFLGKPSALPWTTQLMTLASLVAPILASGIGLVRMDEGVPAAV